jgi:DNA-binding NarL/FixJ family response regulator
MTPFGFPTGQLRVLIADDNRVFAESVMTLLSQDDRIDVVGIASSGEEAVELAAALLPNVVLMDFRMPKLDGLEATRRIRSEGIPVRILLMTGTGGDDLEANDALRAGADAFLRKEQGLEELRRVFFEVASLTTLLGTRSA